MDALRPQITASNANELSGLSYQQLKGLKTGSSTLTVNGKPFTVSWSEERQDFRIKRVITKVSDLFKVKDSGSVMGAIFRHTSDVRQIKQAMTQCNTVRSQERSAAYAARLDRIDLKALFGQGSASSFSMQVVVNNREEAWSPATGKGPAATSSGVTGGSGSSSQISEPPHVLVYGFAHLRDKLMTDLCKKSLLNSRAAVLTIDDYNACIGLSGVMNIGKYSSLINNLQQVRQSIADGNNGEPFISTMIDRAVLEQNIAQNYPVAIGTSQEKVAWSETHVKNWIRFLAENARQFQFADKITNQSAGQPVADDPEVESKTVRFILKNISKGDLDVSIPEASRAASANDWGRLCRSMEPVLTMIMKMDENPDLAALAAADTQLSYKEKFALNAVLGGCMFRETSRLGLSFAAKHGMNVLFSWKDPRDEVDLDALHTILQTKMYRDKNSSGSRNHYYHEAITYSEMRDLGRLSEEDTIARAGDPNGAKKVPDYLLIRKLA